MAVLAFLVDRACLPGGRPGGLVAATEQPYRRDHRAERLGMARGRIGQHRRHCARGSWADPGGWSPGRRCLASSCVPVGAAALYRVRRHRRRRLRGHVRAADAPVPVRASEQRRRAFDLRPARPRHPRPQPAADRRWRGNAGHRGRVVCPVAAVGAPAASRARPALRVRHRGRARGPARASRHRARVQPLLLGRHHRAARASRRRTGVVRSGHAPRRVRPHWRG